MKTYQGTLSVTSFTVIFHEKKHPTWFSGLAKIWFNFILPKVCCALIMLLKKIHKGGVFLIQKAWSLQVFFFVKKLSVYIAIFNVDEVIHMFKQNHYYCNDSFSCNFIENFKWRISLLCACRTADLFWFISLTV